MAVIKTTGLRSTFPLRPLLAALATLTLLASPVIAEDILRLEGPITDTTGVLADRADDITDAIEATLDDGVQVFVLFVRTTGDRTAEEYVDETTDRNSLGGDDALILVALEDRTDQVWVADGLDKISDDELDEIVIGTLEPGLREGDFPAAVIATVEALGAAAVSAPVTAAPVTPAPEPTVEGGGAGSGDGDSDSGGISFDLGPILALLAILVGGYFVWASWRGRSARKRAPGGPSGVPAPDPATLARQSNALLIATDERIRDAAQETDFAEAQYGADAVTTFRAAVAEARDELAKAFVIRQQLDDAIPEDEPTRIAMLQEIIVRTTKAQERLDVETDRIRELHDLERDAPNRIVELPAQIEAVEDRLDATETTMQELRQYAQAVWGPVAGNLEEARKGLAGARSAVTTAGQAIGGARGAVAVATRTAMEGIAGASVLLDEIDQLAASVGDAQRRIPVELAEAGRDLADATSALAGRPVDPAVDARRRAAESALDAARSAAVAQPSDPLATLRLVTEAHRLADETLLAARDAAAAADRVVAAANSTIQTAAAEIDRAATFIASRRRGVGEVARTRLAEAQRHLSAATSLLPTDATGSLNEGKRAQALAHEAYRLAQDDFSDWDQGGPGWGQRRGRGGDQTSQVLGAILGGVIGGVLSGGGRSRGGGWGGSPWGGSGGGRSRGGGWGGGGGFGSGGFGGGGGGGGRSSGGRW
jgi:hypothetical protein